MAACIHVVITVKLESYERLEEIFPKIMNLNTDGFEHRTSHL